MTEGSERPGVHPTAGSDVADESVEGWLPGAGGGDLWLDQFATYLGFGVLTDRFAPNVPPSYVYATVLVVAWTVLSAAADVLVFGTPPIYVTNPYFLLQPIVLIGGVYGAHSLHRSYLEAVDEMKLTERANESERFRDIVPGWLPWALFAAAAGLQLFRAYVNLADFTTMGVVANTVVFPFLYAPILVQFFVVYVGIEFVAPWRLYRSDVGIHFLDPHGVGGLRPIGELIKKAYYFIVVGLVVYALITYAPGVSGWEISATAGTIFTGVWILTILTVAFAVFVLHRFLHREKRRKLQALEAQLRDCLEDPWKVKEYRVKEDADGDVDDIRRRIEEVSSTSEYPATFSIWSQLALSVVIPKAVQLFLTGI